MNTIHTEEREHLKMFIVKEPNALTAAFKRCDKSEGKPSGEKQYALSRENGERMSDGTLWTPLNQSYTAAL